jgi:hypothetical protein
MTRWTNFPNGITSLGIPTFGTSSIPPFTGNYFFVQETTTAGVSAGAGTAQSPYNTLAQALAQCVSGNDDVIFIQGTVHLSAALAWNLDKTHLIGVCSPLKRGKRARISVTGSTPFGPLVNVTGSGCLFQNFGTFFGFPTTGATTPIAWQDSGGRNTYNNVEFLGFGDATVTTGTANQTGARAFKLNTSVGETTFRSCVFGLDTIVRNATNYTVEIAGAAPRVTFENCDFEADLGGSGGGSSHLLVGAVGIDRYLNLIGCRFMNSIKSGATTMTQALNVNAAAGGVILLDQCTGYGFTHWETVASACVLLDMGTVTAHDGGIAVAASPA